MTFDAKDRRTHRFVQHPRVPTDPLCGFELFPGENAEVVCGEGPSHPVHLLAAALDRITELEAAVAAAEGARLAAERGLAGEGT